MQGPQRRRSCTQPLRLVPHMCAVATNLLGTPPAWPLPPAPRPGEVRLAGPGAPRPFHPRPAAACVARTCASPARPTDGRERPPAPPPRTAL